jgi:hypothetical protein
MKPSQLLALPLALAALALTAPAQGVGSTVPKLELEGFAQTKAQTFDDYYGRAVLLEFFAFW